MNKQELQLRDKLVEAILGLQPADQGGDFDPQQHEGSRFTREELQTLQLDQLVALARDRGILVNEETGEIDASAGRQLVDTGRPSIEAVDPVSPVSDTGGNRSVHRDSGMRRRRLRPQ